MEGVDEAGDAAAEREMSMASPELGSAGLEKAMTQMVGRLANSHRGTQKSRRPRGMRDLPESERSSPGRGPSASVSRGADYPAGVTRLSWHQCLGVL